MALTQPVVSFVALDYNYMSALSHERQQLTISRIKHKNTVNTRIILAFKNFVKIDVFSMFSLQLYTMQEFYVGDVTICLRLLNCQSVCTHPWLYRLYASRRSLTYTNSMELMHIAGAKYCIGPWATQWDYSIHSEMCRVVHSISNTICRTLRESLLRWRRGTSRQITRSCRIYKEFPSDVQQKHAIATSLYRRTTDIQHSGNV